MRHALTIVYLSPMLIASIAIYAWEVAVTDQVAADLREQVRSRYGQAARSVLMAASDESAGCCSAPLSDPCCGGSAAAEGEAEREAEREAEGEAERENCFGGPLYGA